MNDLNLRWCDEHRTGIPAVDLQHKGIFDCFVDLIAEGSNAKEYWLADSSYVRLVDLLQQHFALEETMMRSFDYPELDRHAQEHRQFLSELHDAAHRFPGTKGGVPQEMIRVFKQWQGPHVMNSDRHYVEYFSGPPHKNPGRTPGAK
jgi:hemerythrin